MKKQTKQIASALIVLLAVLITGCVDQVSEMSAEEIASQMQEKQAEIVDFSATMITTSSYGGETETMQARMVTMPPDKTRIEYIEPAELAGTVMVTNGSTMWTYDPARNQVTRMEFPDTEDEPFEMDYTNIVKDLMEENDISYKGTENVGGRSTYVIEATPKDENNSEFFSWTRVWVDCENWMVLGIEMYDADDNLVMKVEYREVTFNTGIPDSEFIFEVPEGATVVEESFEDLMPEKMTLEEASANLTFDLRTPSYLPEGYEFEHAMVIGGEHEVVSLQYMNQDERLHLSEQISDDTQQHELSMDDLEVVSINGTDGEFTSMFGMNMLRWSVDGIDYSLSGTLEKDELVKVAESLV
jgi:outer membrane lipoprotein-sorting protein